MVLIIQHVVVFNISVSRAGEEPYFWVNSSLSTWECYNESNVPPADYRGPPVDCHDGQYTNKNNDFLCVFYRNWNMRTLLLYWTFRYVILYSLHTCKSSQEQSDCVEASVYIHDYHTSARPSFLISQCSWSGADGLLSLPHDPLPANAAWTVLFSLLVKWGFAALAYCKNHLICAQALSPLLSLMYSKSL